MYDQINRASLRRRIGKHKTKFLEMPVVELEMMLDAMDAMDKRIEELEAQK